MNLKNKKTIIGWLFVAPVAIVMIVMMLYPILQVVQFSFSKISLPDFKPEFNGLANFERVLQGQDLKVAAKNTVIWTIGSMILRLGIGFAAALVMESKLRGMKIFRTMSLIPWVIPSIVASNTWRWLLAPDNGILNVLLKDIAPSLANNWLGNAATALPSVIVAFSWTGFPFNMLMLVAALQGVEESYKEAARIDGANTFQVFRYVTLPSLKNIMVILVALEFISGINSFDMLYTLTGGGPGTSSETLSLAIYRFAFRNLDFSAASTLSLIVIGIMVLCFLVYVPASAKNKKR